MKRLLLIITCLLAVNVVLFADDDKAIQFKELPQNAQNFIKSYFDESKIRMIVMDKGWIDTDYEVLFVDGSKVEFDKSGDWEKIKCKRSYVPEQVIPMEILNYVKANHSKLKITEIEKKKRGYEIKLDNDLEITFDKQYKVIDYDQ